jgi:hypothetical protein
MAHDRERLKPRIPLLEYFERHNWRPCRAGTRQELVGLCPLHQETRPCFYVNAHKNLLCGQGCGRGGELIRWSTSSSICGSAKACASRTGTEARTRIPVAGAYGRLLSASTPQPSGSHVVSGAARMARFCRHGGSRQILTASSRCFGPFIRSATGYRLDQSARPRPKVVHVGHLYTVVQRWLDWTR